MLDQNRVRRLYDAVAPSYENTIAPLTDPLARAFAESMPDGIVRGCALDLGTGSGIVARRLAPRLAHVSGIDLAPEMIAIAQRLPSIPTLHFVSADIHAPPFAPQSFDLITASFGLNTTDPRRSLRNCRHLLRAGGWLAIQEWAARDALSAAFDAGFAAFIGDQLSTEQIDTFAATHSLDTHWEDALQDADDYREMLMRLGFDQISVSESAPTAVRADSVAAFIEYKLAWPLAKSLKYALEDATQTALIQMLTEQLRPFAAPDGSLIWQPPLFRALAHVPGRSSDGSSSISG